MARGGELLQAQALPGEKTAARDWCRCSSFLLTRKKNRPSCSLLAYAMHTGDKSNGHSLAFAPVLFTRRPG